MAYDEETVEQTFPRRLLEQEGYAGVTHMLADALELWANDENSLQLRETISNLPRLADFHEREMADCHEVKMNRTFHPVGALAVWKRDPASQPRDCGILYLSNPAVRG